jgi:LysR family transcriptional regulator, glycine cleavage system transcriptional activator
MTALRVFEAATRHLSFTGAADELLLTQSAVSKQIRSLEEAFDVSLFIRVNRGLVLTELGRMFLAEIKPSLDQLAIASGRLAEAARSTARTTLTLRILAVIGDRWLLPRLEHFAKAHPNIDLQFTAFMSTGANEQREPDAEVRYGEGHWPGYAADYLFGREMLLVASPRLLATKALENAADIAGFPLLDHPQVADAWPEFFAAHGIAHPATMSCAVRHEFYTVLVRCAVAGMGLGLIPSVWVMDEIARGDLVNPLALRLTTRRGYHFAVPESKQGHPGLVTLRAWILAEARNTPGALPVYAAEAAQGDGTQPQ